MAHAPDPHPSGLMVPRPHRVARRRRETADVVTLTLEPVSGPVVTPAAGQFNMLYAFGIGDVPISTSGDPAEDTALVHTIRAVGPVTRALCQVRRGDVVGVRGPFGTEWSVENAAGSDMVLVAGGIGLAPLRPALVQILAQRRRFGRVTLLVGARTPDDLPFRRDLARWRSQFDLDVDVTVDVAGSDWRGHVGVVTKLIPRAHFDPLHTVALVCGPEVMMRFTAQALIDRGVEAAHVRVAMERNMKCAIALCGHCQFGPEFVCKDGSVFPYDRIARLLQVREL
jgi:NAD(P)H-flavin reductase